MSKTDLLDNLHIAELAHNRARQAEDWDTAQRWSSEISRIEKLLSLQEEQTSKEAKGVIR